MSANNRIAPRQYLPKPLTQSVASCSAPVQQTRQALCQLGNHRPRAISFSASASSCTQQTLRVNVTWARPWFFWQGDSSSEGQTGKQECQEGCLCVQGYQRDSQQAFARLCGMQRTRNTNSAPLFVRGSNIRYNTEPLRTLVSRSSRFFGTLVSGPKLL